VATFLGHAVYAVSINNFVENQGVLLYYSIITNTLTIPGKIDKHSEKTREVHFITSNLKCIKCEYDATVSGERARKGNVAQRCMTTQNP